MEYKQWLKDLKFIVMIIAAVWCVNYYVIGRVVVSGASMEATLKNGDSMLQFKMASIDRFDIVVFPSPTGDKDEHGRIKQYIKRVIGMPGDTIEFREDTLYLNGVATQEPYLQPRQAEVAQTNRLFTRNFRVKEVVPQGKVFVMGDNRNRSQDSEEFGFVDMATLVETNFIFYPLDRFGFLQQYELDSSGVIVPK